MKYFIDILLFNIQMNTLHGGLSVYSLELMYVRTAWSI